MKLNEMRMTPPNKFYIVVESWNYPTESGRNVLEDWDTFEEAMAQCQELAEAEEENNFFSATKCDPLSSTVMLNDDGNPFGYVVSCKNGLDDWAYVTQVVEVNSLC